MPIHGITKLPIAISQEHYIKLLEKLPEIASKLSKINEKYSNNLVSEHFIKLISLKESVQSTRIEGTQVTFAEVIENAHEEKDWKNQEVINYHKALSIGEEYVRNGYPISNKMILQLHETLMSDGRGTQGAGGEFRKIQNHLGTSKRIEDAVYIPVSPEEIDSYMNNWENYTNGLSYGKKIDTSHLENDDDYILAETVDPLIKVAIIHAQFESIHPFLDGNGRVGRILVALFMAQEKLTDGSYFFVSEELEKSKHMYYHYLNGVRGDNPKWYDWINYFLEATDKMANKMLSLFTQIESIIDENYNKCENETQRKIYLFSVQNLNITASEVAEGLGIHQSTARNHLNVLNEKNVLFKNQERKRNIEYYNYEILDLFR